MGKNAFRALLIGLFLSFLPLQPLIAQNNSGYSADFDRLVQMVEQIYLQPNNFSFNQMADEYPSTLAAVMGHAMQAQFMSLPHTETARNRFVDLQDEVLMFVSWLAGMHNGKVIEGHAVTPQMMWATANAGMEGTLNQQITESFRIHVNQVPNFLSGSQPSPAGSLSGGINNKPQGRGQSGDSAGGGLEENLAINLLGVSADPDPHASEDPNNPDRIIGTWQGGFGVRGQPYEVGEAYLTFTKVAQGVYDALVTSGSISGYDEDPPFRGARVKFIRAKRGPGGFLYISFSAQQGVYKSGRPRMIKFCVVANPYGETSKDVLTANLGGIVHKSKSKMGMERVK